jgi:hypothetical protein
LQNEIEIAVPDEEKVMKAIEVVWSTETNEIIEGEVIGNSDDEKKRGKRIGVWKR